MTTDTVAQILREACDFAGDDRKGEYFAFYSDRLNEVAALIEAHCAARQLLAPARLYPDAGLKEPVREFENTLAETVRANFTRR